MADFEIGINEFKSIKEGYSLHINGKLVRDKIPTMKEVVYEMKKYLRIRFKEDLER